MHTEPPHNCTDVAKALGNPCVPLNYDDKMREYRFDYTTGSAMRVDHCPFCGVRFPASLRVDWFERLRAMGLEPEDDIPESMRTGAWWRSEAGEG